MFMLFQAAQPQGASQWPFYGFIAVTLVVVGLLFKAAMSSKDED